MKSVKTVLAQKGHVVFTVSPDTMVYDGLELMMEKNISALLIAENDQLVGIFTERDYARKLVLKGKSSKDTDVRSIMTAGPITVTSNDTVDTCMKIMTEKHIRHLPVVDEGKLNGMISIGDVVKSVINDQKETIQQLETYINS
ncbi:MAG: CBS domain-containing protein [Mucilaginibacter polytrichastri]|nr:CBS domain-containing protein [Mucilaginibacter polytrichastri]